jgi:hypothetical protein
MTKKDWVRADGTVKQDAFIPPRDLHLSVTRHVSLSQDELWAVGQSVADEISGYRGTPFFGRADLSAATVRSIGPLRPVPAPFQNNSNHAHIDFWPADKTNQKELARDLAAAAGKAVQRTTQSS